MNTQKSINNNKEISKTKIKITTQKKNDSAVKKKSLKINVYDNSEKYVLSESKDENMVEIDPIVNLFNNDINFKNKTTKLCRLCFYEDKYYFIDNNDLVYTIPFIYYYRHPDIDKSFISTYLKDQEPLLTENNPNISYLVGVRNKDKINFDSKFLLLQNKIIEQNKKKKKYIKLSDFNIGQYVLYLNDNLDYKIIDIIDKNNVKIQSDLDTKIVNIDQIQHIN